MSEPTSSSDPQAVKIYVLPNIMTAGNLLCGFLAVLKIFEGTFQRQVAPDDPSWMSSIETSLFFILGACIFDLLDGRLARLGGQDSSFGREFDSLADIVSFGLAPALLVFKIVLHENKIGWIIAAMYLVCGALRLARFNVVAVQEGAGGGKEFTGFPIPAAAGLISSITLLMLYFYENQRELERGNAKYALAGLMVFLSWMMFSRFRYPSFKGLGWRTQYPLPKFLVAVGLVAFTIMNYQWMLAVVFLSYLLYGFFRPFLSRAWRREIEEEDEEESPVI